MQEVLDECSWGIYHPKELNEVEKEMLGGGAPKKYTHLFTIYGEHITNVL